MGEGVDTFSFQAYDKARILSPNITTETVGRSSLLSSIAFHPHFSKQVGCHIRMFYHMHGLRNGLQAILKLSEGHEDTLWQSTVMEGVDQNVWKKVDIGFSDSDAAFSLAIQATVGTRERGNIAIDDITFTPQCK